MKHLFLIFLLGTLAACSTNEVDTWNAKPCVWFTEARDTLIFSFYFQPGAEEYVVEIPISMAGAVADVDRNAVVEDLGSSSFNPGSEYEVVSAIIPAGETEGVVRVNVRKTENLNTANDTLTFAIRASETFDVGLSEEYWQNSVIVSNSLAQPSWWNSDAEMYLGYYSDLKMEIIYTVLGSDEIFSGGDYSIWFSDEVTIAIYRLNRYCIDNNVKYNPEDETVVQFDFWTN